ncbi:hypothetical protein L1987_06846 [Smallanthus sonchifolius]|uniref:Uncharacterized protein n=1 Tax=Smallanthus sonchifolius TaxID=185202 RepID=A0ACB9JZH5_9ASTR|nr:hypothetical protein L1987_06846 [Smallanthus sonchifolius]
MGGYCPNEQGRPSFRVDSCTSRGKDEDETLQGQDNSGQRILLAFYAGGGNAAAQASFWQPKIGLSFVLAFESERERNAAIMLARRFAFDCNIMLAGPDDRSAQKTT